MKLTTAWLLLMLFSILPLIGQPVADKQPWIRANLLGYLPQSPKVAVWCSKSDTQIGEWELVDAKTKKVVSKGKAGKAFGAYGPFKQTYRLDFSAYQQPGRYFVRVGETVSPIFEIGNDVYRGTADFALQQYPPDQVHIAYSEYEADLCVMSTEEKRERMLSLVEDWKVSGLTQKAFGLLHGINVATLGYWVAQVQGTGNRQQRFY